ncbi:unnamed protein product [Triticum turgidum subsp. durum]|uniref:DDE Tnp4 domain-containing protein n=1 Tax=Triticum turgidum subsp. durum TaxID=4567 RepID=A0A9R1AEH1_TRITD|nr:unnamed protein product [Triticum turgidum subsp. durum]
MVEWEEWEWEEQVQAMPRLEKLVLSKCRLRHVPPGLASNASSLKILCLEHVKHLSYIESFPSVVELRVNVCLDLEMITNLPNLQKLTIMKCPKLKVLEHIASLERLVLGDYAMEKLPEYMRDIKPRHFQLYCRLWLLFEVAAGQSGTEWDKFCQVEHVKAYAGDVGNLRKWYVLYTRGDNCKLDSNISNPIVFEETLSSCMVDTQGFESVYKMRRSTFSYICSLVRIPFFEDMMARDDGRVLSLQDRVAVALRVLNSGDSPVTVGSSLGVNDSTVLLVTQVFVEAMWERAFHHISWLGSAQMEKMKRKFNKIHGLPNCCGIVQTAHITFGSQSGDHEENDSTLMQAMVDPDIRFTNIWLGPSGSMNQLSVLHDSWLFKSCQEGIVLNGSKVNLSDGLEVGEYIIGDAGYPLLPWLLTPYYTEDKDPSADFPPYQAEFNRRHCSASTIITAALARLKDTWKILDSALGSSPPFATIYACCILHNIVIDMEEGEEEEEEEIAGLEEEEEEEEEEEVRQLADEDAVRVRDVLAKHLIESREEEKEAAALVVASSSGYQNKEQHDS